MGIAVNVSIKQLLATIPRKSRAERKRKKFSFRSSVIAFFSSAVDAVARAAAVL
jgi:hypothetical protein